MLKDINDNKITTHRGHSIRGISENQMQLMLAFLFGAVRARCADYEGLQFAARDILGGANYFWEGTPMEALYKKYINEGKSSEKAIKLAGVSAGHLIKRVLIEDQHRTYILGDAGLANGYKWIGDGPRR